MSAHAHGRSATERLNRARTPLRCQPRSRCPGDGNERTAQPTNMRWQRACHNPLLASAPRLSSLTRSSAVVLYRFGQGMFFEGAIGQYMKPSYRGTKPRAVDARWPKRSPFSPQCPPRLWPSCAADGAIRTALALPLRGTSPCSSEPPQARTATRSLARTTHLPDLPASCWLRLSHPYSITSAAPLALTYVIVKVTSCRTGP